MDGKERDLAEEAFAEWCDDEDYTSQELDIFLAGYAAALNRAEKAASESGRDWGSAWRAYQELPWSNITPDTRPTIGLAFLEGFKGGMVAVRHEAPEQLAAREADVTRLRADLAVLPERLALAERMATRTYWGKMEQT